MTIHYVPCAPGEGRLLLVCADSVLLIEASVSDHYSSLWEALSSSSRVPAVLDALTRGGLSNVPDFALATSSGDRVSVVVRGSIEVTVVTPDGAQSVDGVGVSTWRESSFIGSGSFSIGDPGATLALTGGVVWARGVSAGATNAAEIDQPATATSASGAVLSKPKLKSKPSPELPVVTAAQGAADGLDEQTIVSPPDYAHVDEETSLAPADGPSVAAANGFAHLFEETVVRSIEDAAVRDDPEEPAEDAPQLSLLGDHDGETIMTGDIASLRGRKKPPTPTAAPTAAPALVIEMPDGTTESLEQALIFGRSPSVARVPGGQVPRLVTVPGNQDLSRNHVRFAIEGDTLVVTDLHSRNGTTVALPGMPQQQLRKGEPTSVLVGTTVVLGGSLTLTVKEA